MASNDGRGSAAQVVRRWLTEAREVFKLSVDAVLANCGAGQNGQGQNNNKQGQNQ